MGTVLNIGVSEKGEEPPVERGRRCLSTCRTTIVRISKRLVRYRSGDVQHVADKPGLLALRKVVLITTL